MWKITLIVVLMLAAAHAEAQVLDRLSRGEIILRVTPGAITVEPNGACIVQDLGIAALVPEEGTLRWIPEFRPGTGNGFVFTPNEPDDRTALLSQLGSLECVLLAEPNAFLRSDTITENPSDFYFQTDYWPHRPFTDSPTGLRYARDPGPDVVWEDCELVAYLGSNVGTATDAHELPDQWHLRMTQTDLAWLVEQGDSAVKVAIIDSGVDWRHPDLAPNIWQNPGEDLNHDGTIFRAVPTDSFSSWVEDATDINGVDDDENWGTGQWAATDDIIAARSTRPSPTATRRP
jgi:subtilisin family serine protease